MVSGRPSERIVDVDGVRVRCLVAGDGPPVVLLHGGGLDSATLSWRAVLPVLADRYTVYAPDWPGYGDSDDPSPPTAPSIAYYRRVLCETLDELGVNRAALVGISMGGGVALCTALETPARASRLALIDSYGLGGAVPGGYLGYLFTRLPMVSRLPWALLGQSRRLVALSLRGIVGDPASITEELVDDVVWAARRPGAGRAFEAFQRSEVGPHGLRTVYLDRLPDLSVPTLLIHGEIDSLVPTSWAVRAGILIPDAEVRILPRCGHWPPRERPDRTVELLQSFLNGEHTS